jgi:hypothetical protein
MYCNMLDHFLVPQLDVSNVIWQQNNNLIQTFSGRWIGCGGYIPWPKDFQKMIFNNGFNVLSQESTVKMATHGYNKCTLFYRNGLVTPLSDLVYSAFSYLLYPLIY